VIFIDTNVISETLRKDPDPVVISWLVRFDAELALPAIAIAEIAFGIQKIRPDQRADRLQRGLDDWRRRFEGRIFGLDEAAALVYGDVIPRAMARGRPMSAQDGMIAAIAQVHGGRLATRNIKDFQTTGLELVTPWEI
jgi:predicted nucleic acid-binding protein